MPRIGDAPFESGLEVVESALIGLLSSSLTVNLCVARDVGEQPLLLLLVLVRRL